jgi:hypothetical protein
VDKILFNPERSTARGGIGIREASAILLLPDLIPQYSDSCMNLGNQAAWGPAGGVGEGTFLPVDQLEELQKKFGCFQFGE